MITKGIILAGGAGTRLYPATKSVSKQLLPIFNKPMIYYPLSTLMLAGIREILIITRPEERALFQGLLKDGKQFGVSISYACQEHPRGLADAFIIGRDFIAGDPVCLILGDNLYYGEGLGRVVRQLATKTEGASLLAYYVNDPERYGVVEFSSDMKVLSLEEKPAQPKSSYVITGMYFYGPDVCEIAASIKPSGRGELEITSINQIYFEQGKLSVEVMGRGFAWLDTGSHESMLEASNFVASIEQRQGLLVSSPEEIAYRLGLIDADMLRNLALPMSNTDYGSMLLRVLIEKKQYVSN